MKGEMKRFNRLPWISTTHTCLQTAQLHAAPCMLLMAGVNVSVHQRLQLRVRAQGCKLPTLNRGPWRAGARRRRPVCDGHRGARAGLPHARLGRPGGLPRGCGRLHPPRRAHRALRVGCAVFCARALRQGRYLDSSVQG